MASDQYHHNEALNAASVQGRPATQEEIAYRDGYVQGQSTAQYDASRDRAIANERRRRAAAQETSALATTLSVAFFILALAGIGAAVFYYETRPETAEVENPDIKIELPDRPAPVENNTVIERTVEKTQEVAPARTAIELPDIQINTPTPAPGGIGESAAPSNAAQPPAQPAQSAQPAQPAESAAEPMAEPQPETGQEF